MINNQIRHLINKLHQAQKDIDNIERIYKSDLVFISALKNSGYEDIMVDAKENILIKSLCKSLLDKATEKQKSLLKELQIFLQGIKEL